MKFIRNWKISLPAAGVVLAGLAWLAFGYFGVQTAFIDDEVSEAAPVFDVPPSSADPVDRSDDETIDADADASATVAEGTITTDAVDTTDTAATEAPAELSPPIETSPRAQTTPRPPAEPEIITEASGTFAGTSRYDVSGEAVVLGNGTGQRFLRFEEFESSNGPDLNVYLFNPDDPNDFIDLGDLTGNIGEQNYEIGADVDLDRYSEVSIWCVRFGVAFGSADLATA